jgi:Xaa-Pro aminopeptidase
MREQLKPGEDHVKPSEWERELSNRFIQISGFVTSLDCEAFLVYGSQDRPEPFRYLTNFVPDMGDMWAVAPTYDRQEMSCILNFHWELKEAGRVSGISDWKGVMDSVPLVIEIIKQLKLNRIAVLGLKRIPWFDYQAISSACPNLELIDIQHEFDSLRRIKTSLEIRLLKEAARITDLALDEIRAIARPGLTENDLSSKIISTFYREGAKSAFLPLVMGGLDAETAVIARSTRARPLEKGDSLMLDIGAAYLGYQVDVARTLVLGNPNPQQQKAWSAILKAYDSILNLARPGTPCNKLHETAQRIFQEAGFELIHRIGHGYGLATSFEWPSLDSETALLQPGMTLAIEPGIYAPGSGAMKLEDSILITETGCEVISRSAREL